MRHPSRGPMRLLCLLVPLTVAFARQGSKADYERAARLEQRFADKLLREPVRPEWLDARRLWYEVRTGPEERELVVVDAEAVPAERRLVLARGSELARALGLAPGAARVARLAWEGGEPVRLLCEGGEACSWSRADARFEALDPTTVAAWRLAAQRAPARSGRGRAPSAILFANRMEVPLALYWIELDGKRRAEGTLAPGASLWRSTYERHAWVLVSPEGADVACYVAGARAGVARIDGAALEEGEPREARRGGEERGSSSRLGRWRAFVREHDLWLRDDGNGEERRLTDDGSERNAYREPLLASPDGRFLLCLQVEPAEEHQIHFVESAPADQVQPKLHTLSYLKPGDRIEHPRPRLFRVDEEGRASAIPIAEELFPNPWSLQRLEWERDSSRFCFLYDQRGHQLVRWIAVEAESGTARALIDEATETFIDYSQKRYLRVLPETQEVVWMSERSGWNHLYLLDARDGSLKRQLTSGEWVVRSVEAVDERARTLTIRLMGYYPGQDPYHVHWARVGLDDGSLTLLSEGDGTHELSFSPDGAHYVDSWSRVDLPPRSELRRSADGALCCTLEEADASLLIEAGWRPPQRFVAKGRDGRSDIWGVVYRPTGHDPARRYPLIESIYAGPHDAHVPKSFRVHRKPLELAELGFIVVQIDGMGTNWRSKAFHDVAWHALGDAGFPDRIAWIRALAESDPSLDLGRVGIYGGSAGGQNALRALIAHHEFYRVAVADCGCHDNRMDKIWWNEAWMGWPVGPHYAESSNVAQAGRMQGDLLLIVGELDENVDPASTMQVVAALVKADKDFDLLVIPGAGHGAGETPYGTRRRRDYFVRKLLGVEPRWD